MKERDMTVLRREEEHDICIKQACTDRWWNESTSDYNTIRDTSLKVTTVLGL